MKIRSSFLIAALAVLWVSSAALAADAGAVTPSLEGDAAHPEAARWVRAELYFGVGPADAADAAAREARWRDFLDREVTPRFPDGLSVIEAYGQWRSPGAASPSRLASKVLVILFEDNPKNRRALDEIRSAYKAATHSKSVLLVLQAANVSF